MADASTDTDDGSSCKWCFMYFRQEGRSTQMGHICRDRFRNVDVVSLGLKCFRMKFVIILVIAFILPFSLSFRKLISIFI